MVWNHACWAHPHTLLASLLPRHHVKSCTITHFLHHFHKWNHACWASSHTAWSITSTSEIMHQHTLHASLPHMWNHAQSQTSCICINSTCDIMYVEPHHTLLALASLPHVKSSCTSTHLLDYYYYYHACWAPWQWHSACITCTQGRTGKIFGINDSTIPDDKSRMEQGVQWTTNLR